MKKTEDKKLGEILASSVADSFGLLKVPLRLKKCRGSAILPEYKTEGASGMDLCAAIEEPIEIKPLERALIPTGWKVEIPKNFEAQIRARSGLSIKHGITLINCVGTIDSDYRGEIQIPVVNISNEAYTIQPQERIAQMIIAKYERVAVIPLAENEELEETKRGSGGFGSSGRF